MKISQPVVIVADAGGAGASLTQHLVNREVHVVLLDSNPAAAAASFSSKSLASSPRYFFDV